MKINRSGQAEPLNREQFLTIVSALPYPHKLIFALTWYCAERAGAICRLKVSDCYHDGRVNKIIVIPGRIRKDRVTREVPISRPLEQLLKAYPLRESEWLFPSQLNEAMPINPEVYSHALKREYIRQGMIGYSTHSCRRGAITYLAKRGIHPRQIMAMSGHASLDSVQRYIEVSPSELVSSFALL